MRVKIGLKIIKITFNVMKGHIHILKKKPTTIKGNYYN